jgi:Sec-independent protein translocase protein TatA
MFGINLSEFMVILCIVVIFIRPKDLPRFFYNIGKVYGQLKDAYRGLVKTRDEVLQDLKSEIDSELQPTIPLIPILTRILPRTRKSRHPVMTTKI